MIIDVYDEEEVKSEGSVGSEWLVVFEGKGLGSLEFKILFLLLVLERYVMIYMLF